MKTSAQYTGKIGIGLAAACLLGVAMIGFFGLCSINVQAAETQYVFDAEGNKIFQAYDQTTQTYMTSASGDRTLQTYYSRRQYPGSPPWIPHQIEPSFSDSAEDCLECHAKGGYDATIGKYVPITPHPEKESCRQCHVIKQTEEKFVEHDWLSVSPPRLGRSPLPGGPPAIPHTLQMRENCIACHTGPGAVVEIRVEHSSRGNCRQCHVPMLQSTPVKEFIRNQ